MHPSNGHVNGTAVTAAAPPALTPKQMRDRIRELRVANRYTSEVLQAHRLGLEATLMESWWPYDDPFGGSDTILQKIRSQYGEGWLPLSVPSDRRAGAKWPMWRTEQELGRLRQASRMLCAGNTYAKGLLKNLTNYVIGKGFTYKASVDKKRADRYQVDPDTARLYREAVQQVVDDFLQANRWNSALDEGLDAEDNADSNAASSRERECFRRVKRDGEAFIHLYYLEDGKTLVRFDDPEQVTQPPGRTWEDGWSYGIQWRTDPFPDLECRLAFWVRHHDPSLHSAMVAENPEGIEVPATEMVHVMNEDEDAEVMRGTPIFAFGTSKALIRAEKLQENTSTSSAVRAATAEYWKHSIGTQRDLQNMATGLASRTVYPENAGSGAPAGPARSVQQMYPGMIRRFPEGQELSSPPGAYGVAEHLQAAQGDLRQAGSAEAAPEYLVSGDASNSNYASTSEAGTPFVRNGESEQEHFKKAYVKVVRRAVRWAVKCGNLPTEALRIIKIQAEATQIQKNNDGELAQVDNILLQNKVTDPQTVIMKRGGDPETVMENWKEWEAKMGGGQGQQPGGPPGGPPGPGGPPPGPGGPEQPPPGGPEQPPGGGEQPPQGDDAERKQLVDQIMAKQGGGRGGPPVQESVDPDDELFALAAELGLDRDRTAVLLEACGLVGDPPGVPLLEASAPLGSGTRTSLPSLGAHDKLSGSGKPGMTATLPKNPGAVPKGGKVPPGYTGTITDSLGRKEYYEKGEHVEGAGQDKSADPRRAALEKLPVEKLREMAAAGPSGTSATPQTTTQTAPQAASGTTPAQATSRAAPQAPPTPQELRAAAVAYRDQGTKAPAFKKWFGDWETDPANASKVVSKTTGRPQVNYGGLPEEPGAKVVYHGTGRDFGAFDPARMGQFGAEAGKGFYFTENRDVARQWANDAGWAGGNVGGHIHEVYLNIRKPFDFDAETKPEDWDRALEHLRGVEGADVAGFEKLVQSVKDRGFRTKDGKGPLVNYDLFSSVAKRMPRKDDEQYIDPSGMVQSLGYDGLTHLAGSGAGSPTLRRQLAHDWDEGHGRVWVAYRPHQVKATANRGTFDAHSDQMMESRE